MTALTAATRAQWSRLILTDPHPDPLVRRIEYLAWASQATSDEVLRHAAIRAVRTLSRSGHHSAAVLRLGIQAARFAEQLAATQAAIERAENRTAEGVIPM